MADLDPIDWLPLGQEWWDEAARSCGADERQLKFAVCKFRGRSNTQSARTAGYGDDKDAWKQHGYRLARTRVVSTLLALASAETKGAGPDGSVDKREAKAILSGLARGSDPSVKVRALEALARLESAERAEGVERDDDALREERLTRDILMLPPDARGVQAASWALALVPLAMSRWPLGHDLWPMVKNGPIPQVWQYLLERQSPTMLRELEELMADTGWQLETRRKIWGEVNWEIGEDNRPRPMPTVVARPTSRGKANGGNAERDTASPVS